MIDKALDFILSDLNEYLGNKPNASANVEFATFSGDDDKTDIDVGCVGFGLINLMEETTSKNLPHRVKQPSGQVRTVNPELRLNLHVLFAANRTKGTYKEGLTDISNIISFFQGKKVFTKENSPTLPDNINQLVFDMHSVALEDQSYLWGALGTNYMPSIIYKVRLISIVDDVQLAASAPITEIQQTIG